MNRRSSASRRRTVSRKTTPRKSSSLSKTRSLKARKQRRHSDGTFAKGFKAHASPKKTSVRSTSRNKGSTVRRVSPPKRRTVARRSSRTSTAKKGYTPKMYAAEKAFDFRCNSATKEKVIRTVVDNFTKDEIEKIGSQGKPIVSNTSNSTTTTHKDTYARKETKNPKSEAEIILKNSAGETTITHEVVHHLRTVDSDRDKYAKTAYPVDRRGVTNSDKTERGPISKKKISNAEETATVAETELRTKNSTDYVSKYWKVDRNQASGRDVRDSDRKTMRKHESGTIPEGSNATGKKAIDLVNENYPKTIVSSRREGGESALSTFRSIIDRRKKNKW